MSWLTDFILDTAPTVIKRVFTRPGLDPSIQRNLEQVHGELWDAKKALEDVSQDLQALSRRSGINTQKFDIIKSVSMVNSLNLKLSSALERLGQVLADLPAPKKSRD